MDRLWPPPAAGDAPARSAVQLVLGSPSSADGAARPSEREPEPALASAERILAKFFTMTRLAPRWYERLGLVNTLSASSRYSSRACRAERMSSLMSRSSGASANPTRWRSMEFWSCRL